MKGALSISDLNKYLSEEAQIPIVTHQQYQIIHRNNHRSSKFERFVADVKNVNTLNGGYKFTMNNGKTIEAYFNGEIVVNGKHSNHIDYNTGITRISQNNSNILLEKLLLTAKAILENELPVSFKNIEVNVMDGTGNLYTALKMGLCQNFKLNNLEWTLHSLNSTHGQYIIELFNLVKRPISFSANDKTLYEIYQTRTKQETLNYINKNY